MAFLHSSMWLLLVLPVVIKVVFVSACSDQEFTCDLGLCVDQDSVCDFTDDCEEGSDEEDCSTCTRCDFEDGFCDLTQSSETFSEWIRTTEAAGIKQDHTNTSAHFLALLPAGGNRTTADLNCPAFQPSSTCRMSFYYYVGAKIGDLQVVVWMHSVDQTTEVWKCSTSLQTETWQRAVVDFNSSHSFQITEMRFDKINKVITAAPQESCRERVVTQSDPSEVTWGPAVSVL